MAARIKNIIFDWSGTLCDDVRRSYLATRHAIRHFGGPRLSFGEYRAQFDLPVWQFYRRHVRNISIDEIDRYYFDYFAPHARRSRLFNGVIPVLEEAKRQRLRLYVFSTVRQELLESLLRRNRVRPYFKGVLGSVRDKERSLPGFCRRFHLKKNETLFMGDMEHDIRASKKAGIGSGAFLGGYHIPARLLKHAPDFVWNDWRGMEKFIRSRDTARRAPTRGKNYPTPTVGALIFHRGEIFLIQTHKWGYTFGIPGGKIRHGEPMEAALRREIGEETGLILKNIRWAMVQDSIRSQEFYRKGQHFLLLNFYAESSTRKFHLNDEAFAGIWVEPNFALKLRLNEPTRVLLEYYLNK